MVRLVFVFLILTGCGVASKLSREYPDEIVIHHLYPLSTSFVSITCDRVKKIADVKKLVIKDRKEIERCHNVFEEKSNFQLDTSISIEDFRISIAFVKDGRETKTICWSHLQRCLIDGKVYRYNEKVETFLLDYGLIFKK